jgi:enamine deaminase RidA (YjgF/YER057c/UK114 family)
VPPTNVGAVEITLIDQQAGFAEGALVTGAGRLLFVAGQVPWDADTGVPADFESQCRLAWRNVLSVVDNAGMSVTNLVKVTIVLSDRKYGPANARIRQEVLGDHSPAMTIIIGGVYNEDWLLAIDAVAAG